MFYRERKCDNDEYGEGEEGAGGLKYDPGYLEV